MEINVKQREYSSRIRIIEIANALGASRSMFRILNTKNLRFYVKKQNFVIFYIAPLYWKKYNILWSDKGNP